MSSIFEPTPIELSTSTPISMGNLILEFTKSTDALYRDIDHQRKLSMDSKRTKTLLEVARDYGLNKSTMKLVMADPGAELLGSVDVPSVESFDIVNVSDKDARTRKVMEAAMLSLQTDRDGLSSGIQESQTHMDRLMGITAFYLEETLPLLKSYRAKLDEAAISEEGLDVDIVQALPADSLGETLVKLTELNNELEPLQVDAVVTGDGILANTRTAMEEIGETFQASIGLSTDGCGNLMAANEGLVEEAYQPREGTMRELGYHPEVITSLMDSAIALGDSLQKVVDNKTAYLGSYDTAVESLGPIGDGVAGYTFEDHRDVMNTYNCLLTSAIDHSVQSIMTMLGVAEVVCA